MKIRPGLQEIAILVLLGCTILRGTDAGRPQPDTVASDLESRDDCQPVQVHLALTGNPSEMRVSWKTAGSGCGARLHSGLDNGGSLLVNPSENGIMPGEETTYSADDMCSLPAAGYEFEPPHLHTEVLTGLVPGEKYQYRIGGHDPVFSFRAAPRPDPSAGFKFIVYGDMGESDHKAAKSPGAEDTAENVKQEVFDRGADMVLHVGDISYANGDVKIWDTFMRYIEPYASSAPYMIAVGNHEYDYRTGGEHHKKHHPRHPDASGSDQPYDPDWGNFGNDSGGECGVAVAKRFRMPDATLSGNRAHAGPVSSNAPFWYSFEYGSAHFTVISTEHDVSHGSDQRKWLEADIASVNRCVTPWLLVAMHRPMYVPYPHKSNRIVGRHLQDILEDLFLDSEVDMVMSGHVHLYARTCSVKKDRCKKKDRGGITHVTVGCAGHKLSAIEDDQKAWIANAASHFGYGRVTVEEGGRSLLWEYVRNKDGRVHDSARLINSQLYRCNAKPGNATDAASPGRGMGLDVGSAVANALAEGRLQLEPAAADQAGAEGFNDDAEDAEATHEESFGGNDGADDDELADVEDEEEKDESEEVSDDVDDATVDLASSAGLPNVFSAGGDQPVASS